MIKQAFLIILGTLVVFTSCKNSGTKGSKSKSDFSGIQVDTDSESEKFSYSLGMIIGNTLQNNGIDSINYSVVDRAFEDSDEDQVVYSITASEVQRMTAEEIDVASLDENIVKRAIYDVLDGDTTLLTITEVGQAYQTYIQNNQTKIGERNLSEGKKFLEENLNKDGIKVTESGLQYQLITEGDGGLPSDNDVIEVYFKGDTVNGTEFIDNSEEPSYVDLSDNNADFAGLVEGVRLFPIGSEFNLYVPSNLGFGAQRMSPDVGPNSTLIIHVTNSKKMDDETKKQYRAAKEAYYRQLQQQQQQQMR